ncbi:39S ribosomal protein L4, mitochondrial [Lingula anatina]|uniref:Large ribosomal subunit protein uL4m n=1 Tax=Lingula anatina TaxID=7574 RepID=A0A1S3K2F8_LINAN|nr:39S ribosomal protein L4, mitochondrial [Lingula anatina]|eukprot:XP_013416451.1 39S ribosomal protein L4, mitochondrial [Lingula anatina]
MLPSVNRLLSLFVRDIGNTTRPHIPLRFSRTLSTLNQESQPAGDNVLGEEGTGRLSLPLMTEREIKHPNPYIKPRLAWLETLGQIENKKLGIINLHPDIFATFPRLDIIHNNVLWQQTYRRIDYATTKTRAEVQGSKKKPWPQKGQNKARHGHRRSPLWKGGGVAKGPRGPRSYFFMLPTGKRVMGLRATLTCKYAQDNLHIVDSLDIPQDDPEYLQELIEHRNWGLSVLFVDDDDIMPENIILATDPIGHFNVMPVYGLNVYSMLKHETLVLTLRAVEKIEERLLHFMHKPGPLNQKWQAGNVGSFRRKSWV